MSKKNYELFNKNVLQKYEIIHKMSKKRYEISSKLFCSLGLFFFRFKYILFTVSSCSMYYLHKILHIVRNGHNVFFNMVRNGHMCQSAYGTK